jgi:acetyl esterase/lipase
VRVKGSLAREGWRAGTAHVMEDDDPAERVRILSEANRWTRRCLQASTAVETAPLTVRVDLDPLPAGAAGRAGARGAGRHGAEGGRAGDGVSGRDAGVVLEPALFSPAAVPPETLRVTEELRRAGAVAGAPSVADLPAMRVARPDGPGPLRVQPTVARAVEQTIEGPGGPLRLRVLAPAHGEARAWYLHLHGGGWSVGGADRQDETLARLADTARVAVASLEYRLAPEHPHPAAIEDCTAALRWLLSSGPTRAIVGGESAGAQIAAAALVVLRDHGQLGGVLAANLAYGHYDVSMTPSARGWGEERVVTSTPDLAFFANQYAPAARRRDPDVSPLYADLRDLPPALFSVGTRDPLLDDTLFMAARWQAAGNATELDVYPGAPHEFLNLRAPIAAEYEARQRMLGFVERVLAG